jgi:3-oxoacyl-[acyl-carrier protein] reductase
MGWTSPFAEFEGRVVLVTGSSTGIGAAVARGFAACGAHVVLHVNRSVGEAEALRDEIAAEGGRAFLLRADLSDPAAAARLAEDAAAAAGRLDILVNNAGDTLARRPVADIPLDDYRRIVDLNFGSVFALSRAALPIFRAQGRGTIVNTGSISARIGGSSGSVLYAAAKAAVSTFTRGLARELAPEGIRVNAVAPGVVDTKIHRLHTSPDVLEKFVAAIPLGRAGVPDDCVGAYLYLASERLAGFVTGQVLEVNGGQFMA